MDKSTISIVGVASVEVGGVSFSLRFGLTAFTSIDEGKAIGVGSVRSNGKANSISVVQSLGGVMGSFGSLDGRGLLGSHSTIRVDNKVGVRFSLTAFTRVNFSLTAFTSINDGIGVGIGKNWSTNTIGIT